MKLNLVAILIGTALYLLLALLQQWMVFVDADLPIHGMFDELSNRVYVVQLYIVFNAVLPGYVTGRIAKNRVLLHAGIVAIAGASLAPVVTDLYIGSNNYWLALFWGLMEYGVICTLSGLLGGRHASITSQH